jgi:hypothetical protein
MGLGRKNALTIVSMPRDVGDVAVRGHFGVWLIFLSESAFDLDFSCPAVLQQRPVRRRGLRPHRRN